MGFISLLSSVNLCFALMKRLQCHVYMDSGVTRKIKCLGGGFQRYLSLSVNKETEFSLLIVFLVVADGEGMSNYNEQFVEAWKLTTNYQAWRGKEHAGIDDVHAG